MVAVAKMIDAHDPTMPVNLTLYSARLVIAIKNIISVQTKFF
jgi:hypothetical protein